MRFSLKKIDCFYSYYLNFIMINVNIRLVLVFLCIGRLCCDEIHPITAELLSKSTSSIQRKLPNKHFRCNDGEYISGSNFCPRHEIDVMNPWTGEVTETCHDGSDHTYGCDKNKCGKGYFKCENGTCLDISVRCNTKRDCFDGSDELNCGDEVNVQNCSFAAGKFLCHDNLRCLDLEYTCDQECNCFDCSDEKENCTTHDAELMNKCPLSYFTTPNGPKCFCDSNNPEMKNLCEEIKPCAQSNICNQRCRLWRNKISCSCYDDYSFIDTSDASGFVCASKVSYDNLLAYSTSNKIKIVNLTSGENIFIKKKVQCSDVVGIRDHLYYTSYDYSDRKTIYRTSISSGMITSVIQSNSSIVSFAVDYVTDNVYFTTNISLSVCSNDGRICTLLKCCNVRYVALAPKSRLMFYMKKSDYQDEKFIMISSMDGSNEDYMVDGGFSNFTALAVDESTRKLYWTQSEESEIWSISYDEGSKELRSIKYHGILRYFSVLDSELFFTKLRDNEIYRIQNIERYTKYFKKSYFGALITPYLTPYYSYGSFPSYGLPAMHDPYLSSLSGPFRVGHVQHVQKSILPFTQVASKNRVKGKNLPTTMDDYFPPTVVSLEGISLNDNNATRLVDKNVTFAIKDLYAYNPTWQASSKNPCSKVSCNGLCLLRAKSPLNDDDWVCICDDLTEKSGQNWCGDSYQENNPTAGEYSNDADTRKNEPLVMKSQSAENHKLFIVTIVLVSTFVLGMVVLGVYFVFRKRSWSEYSRTLRYWRSNRSLERENMCDRVEM